MNKRKILTSHDVVFIPPRELNIWSTVTLISIPICNFVLILATTNPLCQYIFPIISTCILLPKTFLVCFTISQLKSLFSFKKDGKNGDLYYSNSVFITLYIFGFILAIGTMVSTWFFLSGVDEDCSFTTSLVDVFGTIGNIAVAMFLLWSITIMLLYILKIKQLQIMMAGASNIKYNDSKAPKTLNNAIHQLLMMTRKFTCLNLTMQIEFVIIYSLSVVLSVTVLWGFDFVVTSYIMFLMMEHNGIGYYNALVCINRMKCRLCFCGLVPDIKSKSLAVYNGDGNGEKNGNNNGSSIVNLSSGDGKGGRGKSYDKSEMTSETDSPGIKYDDRSEMTMTNV